MSIFVFFLLRNRTSFFDTAKFPTIMDKKDYATIFLLPKETAMLTDKPGILIFSIEGFIQPFSKLCDIISPV